MKEIKEILCGGSGMSNTCKWKLDTTEYAEIWKTECGTSWSLVDTSDLTEHEMYFCHKCGGKIEDITELWEPEKAEGK